MSKTLTKQIPLHYAAPEFLLPDTISEKIMSFSEIKGEYGTVVMFICNHCPYVIHVREQLVLLANDFKQKGIGFVAISSNDINGYPEDAPIHMKRIATEYKFPFPYLYDESQEIAKKYVAECTPDFSVFDAQNLCVYRGQLDSSRPGNGEPVTGADLREVLMNLIESKPISEEQVPSMGCNIKWKNL